MCLERFNSFCKVKVENLLFLESFATVALKNNQRDMYEQIQQILKQIPEATENELKKNPRLLFSYVKIAKNSSQVPFKATLANFMMSHFASLYSIRKEVHSIESLDEEMTADEHFKPNVMKDLYRRRNIKTHSKDVIFAPPIKELKEAFHLLAPYITFVSPSFFKRMSTKELSIFMQYLPSSITHIDVSKVHAQTNEELSKKVNTILRNLPKGLKSFKMSQAASFGDEELLILVKRCQSLEFVDISNSQISIIDPLMKLQNIKQLKLESSHNLKDISALRQLSKLECLDLSNSICRIDSEIDSLPILKTLILKGCRGVLDIEFLYKLDQLKILDLRECSSVKNWHIVETIKKQLDVCYLGNKTMSDMAGLKQAQKQLKGLTL
jgi:Leucine-rich repeat (LRR) protein